FARMRWRIEHVCVATTQHGFTIVRAVAQRDVCQETIILIPPVTAGTERHFDVGAVEQPVRHFRGLPTSAFGPALGVCDLRSIDSKDPAPRLDRKSTRLNSSHASISY